MTSAAPLATPAETASVSPLSALAHQASSAETEDAPWTACATPVRVTAPAQWVPPARTDPAWFLQGQHNHQEDPKTQQDYSQRINPVQAAQG